MNRVEEIISTEGSWCDELESLCGSGYCQSEAGCILSNGEPGDFGWEVPAFQRAPTRW